MTYLDRYNQSMRQYRFRLKFAVPSLVLYFALIFVPSNVYVGFGAALCLVIGFISLTASLAAYGRAAGTLEEAISFLANETTVRWGRGTLVGQHRPKCLYIRRTPPDGYN